MSVRERTSDAVFLWENGRRESALMLALVAVAATSRVRFPDRNAVGDREAFERFLKSVSRITLSVEYRGTCHPIEHIFYKWFRCELVHEGRLPVDIEFMSDTEPGALTVRAGGAPNYVLKISDSWFHHLVGAVVNAPENAGVFAS